VKISHEFTVERPLATVWDFFEDVPQVVQCLPGAELTGDRGDGGYSGRVTVKLGPLSVTFDGQADIRTDPTTHSGTIGGRGSDRRGGSRGSVTVRYVLIGDETATTVSVEADVTLTGPAAQFGRSGIVTELNNRLIGEFIRCVEGKLAADNAAARAEIRAPEVHGFALFWASLLAWARRLLRPRTAG
jgi:uncharacterized protein